MNEEVAHAVEHWMDLARTVVWPERESDQDASAETLTIGSFNHGRWWGI